MKSQKLEENVNCLLDLKQFGISPTRGFLSDPDPPLSLSHKEYVALDQIGEELPELNEKGQIRKAISDFPLFEDIDELEGMNLNRAMMIIHFVQSSFVFARGEEIAQVIPKQIAIPSYKLAKKFGKPPILSYCSYALHNYRLINPSEGFEVANIETIQKFTRNPNEQGFIRVHTAVEAASAPIIVGIGKSKYHMLYSTPVDVEIELWKMASCMFKVRSILTHMWYECSPNVYYKEVRPWIQGFNGIVYEGVEEYQEKPQSLRGETGAQSSLIPSIVSALSIRHEQNPLVDHLADMMNYMPSGHREFINLCWQKPSIREYVIQHCTKHPGLIEAFNALIEGIYAFRSEHNRFQMPYIIDRIPEEQRGTGGTPFKEWLPKLRDETIAHRIKY